jgi:hypothetical protein
MFSNYESDPPTLLYMTLSEKFLLVKCVVLKKIMQTIAPNNSDDW